MTIPSNPGLFNTHCCHNSSVELMKSKFPFLSYNFMKKMIDGDMDEQLGAGIEANSNVLTTKLIC